MSASSAGAAAQVVAFHHIGIHVESLDASCAFYREVIGLVERGRQIRDDPYLHHVTGYPGVQLAIALMEEPVSGVCIELVEYRDVPRSSIDTRTANPGTTHICFEVDDVDGIHVRALAAGYTAVNPPITPTGGQWRGGRSVYLIDPNGIRVEVVQPGNVPPVLSESVWLAEIQFAADAERRRAPVRADHLARIARLKRRGTVLEGGAFLDELSSSIMLIRAPTRSAAQEVVEGDVYFASGVWESIRIRPFGRVAR